MCVEKCDKNLPQNLQVVKSRDRFRAYTGSEHTPVQSLHRFRAYAGSSIRRFREYTGSVTHRSRAYVGLKHVSVQADTGSSIRRFRAYVGLEHVSVQADAGSEHISVQSIYRFRDQLNRGNQSTLEFMSKVTSDVITFFKFIV